MHSARESAGMSGAGLRASSSPTFYLCLKVQPKWFILGDLLRDGKNIGRNCTNNEQLGKPKGKTCFVKGSQFLGGFAWVKFKSSFQWFFEFIINVPSGVRVSKITVLIATNSLSVGHLPVSF